MSAAVASKSRFCCQQRGPGLSEKDHIYCSPESQDVNRDGSTSVTNVRKVAGQGQTCFISGFLDGQFDTPRYAEEQVA